MSDRDVWPDNPNDLPQDLPPSGPPAKFSGCFKVFLIVGSVGFVTILLCCGVVGWFVSQSIPEIVKVPAEVSAIGQQIMKIEIPDDFVGETGVTFDNKLLEMRFANFRQKQGKGTLMLGGFRVKFGDPQAQKGMFQSRSTQHSESDLDLEITKLETRTFTIRGQKVPFRFSEGEDRKTKKKYHLVEGELNQPGGGVFLKLMLEEDVYDDDAAVKLIESIE